MSCAAVRCLRAKFQRLYARISVLRFAGERQELAVRGERAQAIHPMPGAFTGRHAFAKRLVESGAQVTFYAGIGSVPR